MRVKELIEELKKMPPDAEVKFARSNGPNITSLYSFNAVGMISDLWIIIYQATINQTNHDNKIQRQGR